MMHDACVGRPRLFPATIQNYAMHASRVIFNRSSVGTKSAEACTHLVHVQAVLSHDETRYNRGFQVSLPSHEINIRLVS